MRDKDVDAPAPSSKVASLQDVRGLKIGFPLMLKGLLRINTGV